VLKTGAAVTVQIVDTYQKLPVFDTNGQPVLNANGQPKTEVFSHGIVVDHIVPDPQAPGGAWLWIRDPGDAVHPYYRASADKFDRLFNGRMLIAPPDYATLAAIRNLGIPPAKDDGTILTGIDEPQNAGNRTQPGEAPAGTPPVAETPPEHPPTAETPPERPSTAATRPSAPATGEPSSPGVVNGPVPENRAVPEPVAGAAIGGSAELAACLAAKRPPEECLAEAARAAGIGAITGPPGSSQTPGGAVAGGAAIAGEVAFYDCIAQGGSPPQCLAVAVKSGATAALCGVVGVSYPTLGAICGSMIEAGREGVGAILAGIEASEIENRRRAQATVNDANRGAFIAHTAEIERRIGDFQNAAGHVMEACLRLRSSVGEMQRMAAQSQGAAACLPTAVITASANLNAAYAAAANARQAGARSRELESQLVSQRARLMIEITGLTQSYSRTSEMINLVAQYQTHLQMASCSPGEIDNALVQIDQAAAQVMKAQQAAAACPTAPAGSAPGTPPAAASAPREPCNIYVLNLSGPSVWVGTESDRLSKGSCTYLHGGLSCSTPAQVLKQIGSYRYCSDATAAWCNELKGKPKQVGYWKTTRQVYGDWVVTENAPDCPDAERASGAATSSENGTNRTNTIKQCQTKGGICYVDNDVCCSKQCTDCLENPHRCYCR
jgi:hypothetical protein